MQHEKKNQDVLQNWCKFAKVYDPIKCASIDGTDVLPHDRAVERALKSTYRPNRFVKGHPQCTIFVSRLNHETTKDTIKDIFSKYGKLKRFRMVKDIVTGMPKGYAFVEYEEERAAEDAYRLANKMVVDGNVIFVDFECERLLKGWIPRRLGGGFGGKKESGQLRFGGRDRPFKKPITLEIQEEEERKAKEKERRKREEEKRRERHRERTHGRKRSPLRLGSNSPGGRDCHSPPRKISKRYTPPKEARPVSEKTHFRSPVNDSYAGKREQSFNTENTRHNRDYNDHMKLQSRESVGTPEDKSPNMKGSSFRWEQNASPNHTDSSVRNYPSVESKHRSLHNEDAKHAESPNGYGEVYSQDRRVSQRHSPQRLNTRLSPRRDKFYTSRDKRRSPNPDNFKRYPRGGRRH
ncbi:hypothetical protein GWI33_008157 [Rhynchophorus ferrugineus]|uniref:U11/U12 small nuclear ribonucleoprotein 35 kDa protein n=1 Tax=Rhynchophorus ferrugineus TaxID=354439 RepID=A0A834MED7_RHYFE|nr:hypothetical protein GWI33_008157 [Rhynchophorus ferrugineus]